jgi:HD-like signal output (HDOD) protein/CheY-like chemotaxis protein
MKKRILFVDDQPNVLAALRRTLRSLRDAWEMEFAQGGQEALSLLKQRPFDVVVSDMRMPGIDGTRLLDTVRREYPDTVRIVLSGQSDREAIMRSVGPAHQYLTKPCDTETLKSTITRACALRDRLGQPVLKRLISQVTTLPSVPATYAKLIDELNSPDASVKRVGELISTDVAMTAKLMQLVNSSFFGLPCQIESPGHAAALLGLNLLRPLVLSASIFSQYDGSRLREYSLDALVDHSLAVSTLAQRIVMSEGKNKQMADDALLAGMLHDVGQLVLAANLPDDYSNTLSLAWQEHIPLFQAEDQTLGANHADVGAYLLGLWACPNSIVEAVSFHHEPGHCANADFSALTAVHVANVLVNETHAAVQPTLVLEFDHPYLERVGVAQRLPRWRDMMPEAVTEGVPT